MIINSTRRYVGSLASMHGERVVEVTVLRESGDDVEILTEDAAIGDLQPDDRFEYVQIVANAAGTERAT